MYQKFAMAYGWTPGVVGKLTLSQVLLYMPGKDGKPISPKRNGNFKEQMLKRRKLLQEAHKKYKGSVPNKVCQVIFKQTEV